MVDRRLKSPRVIEPFGKRSAGKITSLRWRPPFTCVLEISALEDAAERISEPTWYMAKHGKYATGIKEIGGSCERDLARNPMPGLGSKDQFEADDARVPGLERRGYKIYVRKTGKALFGYADHLVPGIERSHMKPPGGKPGCCLSGTAANFENRVVRLKRRKCTDVIYQFVSVSRTRNGVEIGHAVEGGFVLQGSMPIGSATGMLSPMCCQRNHPARSRLVAFKE